MEEDEAAGQRLIIAGDGYAYVSYSYEEPAGEFQATHHLMLLRVSSSGAADRIHVYDWTAVAQELSVVDVAIITNADKGILLTWDADPISGSFHGMATVTGTSVQR